MPLSRGFAPRLTYWPSEESPSCEEASELPCSEEAGDVASSVRYVGLEGTRTLM